MTQVMIDTTGDSLPGLLAALQGRYPGVLGGYVTGTSGVDWPAFFWTELAGHVGLVRIDQQPGAAHFRSGAADVADCEALADTIADGVAAADERETKHGWYSWLYFSHDRTDATHGGLAEARERVQAAGLKRVRYWVADWGFNVATAQAFLTANQDVDAVQWASPTSNPGTLCPGTSKTLAELNCDLSVARDGWFDPPRPPKPPRTLSAVTVKFSDGSEVTY